MKKVLIIDDAQFMRLSLRNMLEKNGFEIIGEAENGKIGVEKYKQLKPDLVTMDITMPVMEGTVALKEIMKVDPKAKVLIISALGQETKVRETLINGAKGFVVKPFKEAYLIDALNKL